MLSFEDLFNLVQTEENVAKAYNAIIRNEMDGDLISEQFSYKGREFRFRGTNSGTFNVDYLHNFTFKIDSLGIEESIEFFKPLGFYHFEKNLKIAFFIRGEFMNLAKQQDTFSNKNKLVEIRYGANLTNNAIVAGFSAENKLVLNTLFLLSQTEYVDRIAEFDPLFLTRRYKYVLSINELKLKYISPRNSKMIQVYLTSEFEINTPILALTELNKLIILPSLKNQFDKLSEYGQLSHNEI